MPQVDTRPAAIAALVYPSNSVTFTLAFPADYLDGKTWSASVGATALVPSVAGDVMTIAISGAVTTALGKGRHRFHLTDTTSDDQVRIRGLIHISDSATDEPDQTISVTIADVVPVTISVASGEPGVPAGGTTGQALVKASDDDYDTEWGDVEGSGAHPDLAAHNTLGLATQAELDTEAATRAAADTSLDGRVDTLELLDPVLEGDARLTDARAPTAHKATHENGGADELALDASQVTTGTFDDARIPAAIARDSEVTAAVTAHEAAANPHPGYLTPAEGNAAYDAFGAAAAAQAAAVQRSNHTGTQLAATISDFNAAAVAAGSGTYVPRPAVAPTVGQILSATDDDPLTTDWIDAPAGEVTQQELDDVNDNLTTLITAKQAAIAQQTAAPGSPSTGDLWIDTDAPGLVIAEVHATASHHTSTAEGNLCSLSLPGGLVQAGDVLRFVAFGDLLNDTGAGSTVTWRFKIGATDVLVSGSTSNAQSANRRKWMALIDIMVESTTAQRVGAILNVSSAGTANWGTISTTGLLPLVGYGTAAEDLSAAKNIILSIQHSVSSASIDARLHAASLSLLHV